MEARAEVCGNLYCREARAREAESFAQNNVLAQLGVSDSKGHVLSVTLYCLPGEKKFFVIYKSLYLTVLNSTGMSNKIIKHCCVLFFLFTPIEGGKRKGPRLSCLSI